MSSRRRAASTMQSKATKLTALEQMAKARAGGGRNDQFEVPEEEDLYDEVDEDAYTEIVAARRKREDFVVDDDGLGYDDDGEDHLFDGPDAATLNKRGVHGNLDAKGLKKAKKLKGQMQASSSSGLEGGGSSVTDAGILGYMKTAAEKKTVARGPKPVTIGGLSAPAKPSLDLDSMLNDLSAAATVPAASKGGKSANPFVKTPTSMRPKAAAWTPAPALSGPADYDADEYQAGGDDDYTFDNDDDDYQAGNGDDEEDGSAMKEGDGEDASAAPAAAAPAPRSRFATNAGAAALKAAAEASALKKEQSEAATAAATATAAAASAPSVKAASLDADMDLDSGLAASSNNPALASQNAIDTAQWLGKDAESGDTYLDLYWMDAWEQNGAVYLFGKVAVQPPAGSPENTPASHVSCCVVVKNLQRCMFVLPRALPGHEVDDQTGKLKRFAWPDVHKEVGQVLSSVIPKGSGTGFKCKVVKRKYAFDDVEIPREETEYLKVVYPASYPPPPLDAYAGGVCRTIDKIMGAQTSPLEHFIVKRKFMGPQWVRIKNPNLEGTAASWCKIEVNLDDPKAVVKCPEDHPSPTVTTMTVQMKTVVNPKTHAHEVVAVAACLHKNVALDCATEENRKAMKWFIAVRPLGTSAGTQHPARLPHDLKSILAASNMAAVQQLPNERALLSMLFTKIGAEDPDVLVSHNLFGFDFDVLLTRAVEHKLGVWSKMGRLRKAKLPAMKGGAKGGGGNNREAIIASAATGRILADTYLSARDLLREENYSLSHLGRSYLKAKDADRVDIDPMDVPAYFCSSQHVTQLVHHLAQSAGMVQKLLFKLQVLPLTKQLTNISGNLWASTAKGGDRAKRIEYLLLHEFHRLKFICPDKQTWQMREHAAQQQQQAAMNGDGPSGGGGSSQKSGAGAAKKGRGKPQYAGGLVLEPKKGLYETYILLLDFNSLYPSIIQEFNICFTTMDWAPHVPKMMAALENGGGDVSTPTPAEGAHMDEDVALDAVQEAAASGALPPPPDEDQEAGVVPKVIRTIIQRRVAVKGILKQERDPAKRQTLDIRQKALKLTANSLYGCLGFANSRFYAKPIAALVTAMGRDTLQRTVDLAQTQLNLEVIYGDTDSIMVNTASTDLTVVKKLGQDVKREVNKLYKTLELEVDGIFKSMLLLKKKKYAALVVEEKPDGSIGYVKETKGLDLVRRDWCRLSKTLGQFVLDQILSGANREEVVEAIHSRMDQVASAVRANEVPVDDFVVTKGMNKAIKDYPDAKSMPHLQVALAMIKDGKPVNTGDHIPYVICVDTTPGFVQPASFAQRAYHPDVIAKSDGRLAVDYEWYLTQQILPPIARLCEPIEGTSTAQLAERLGLDAAKFARISGADADDDAALCDYVPSSKLDDSERFKGTTALSVPCGACNHTAPFKGAVSFSLGSATADAGSAAAAAGSSSSAAASAGGLRSGLYCGNCGVEFLGAGNAANCFAKMSNLLSLRVRADKAKYYEAWMVCDDSSCQHRTQQQSVVGNVCLRKGCAGRVHPEFSEKQLHAQLTYYRELFDEDVCIRKQKLSATAQAAYAASKASKSSESSGRAVTENHRQVYGLLKQQMGGELERCGYNWVPKDFWRMAYDPAAAAKGGK